MKNPAEITNGTESNIDSDAAQVVPPEADPRVSADRPTGPRIPGQGAPGKKRPGQNRPGQRNLQQTDAEKFASGDAKAQETVPDPLLTATPTTTSSSTAVERAKKTPFWKRPLFYVTVVIPTILSVIYFGFLASDVYVSESHFVVRNSKQQASSSLLGVFLGGGATTSLSDTYTVQDYLLSKDAMNAVNEEFGIYKSWQRKEIDFLNRFAGVASWNKSLEAFISYYQSRVTVTVDSTTSVAWVFVTGFSRDEVVGINEMLLKRGEELVNKLSNRATTDSLKLAANEVELARKKDQCAAKALNDYRIANSLVDPTAQSAAQLSLISNLNTDLISSKVLLAQAEAFSTTNPQIPLLQKRIEIVTQAIAEEMKKITGGDNASLIAKQGEYDRLVTEKTFTSAQVAAALTNYEQARTGALTQQLYLERIANPSNPDVAAQPMRVRAILTTLLFGMIAWGILSLIVAGVREHLG